MITFRVFTEKVDPAIIKRINAKTKEKFWKDLLLHMDQLVKKGGTRHSLGGYASDVLRSFNVPGLTARDLAKKYKDVYESTHPLTDEDLVTLNELSNKTLLSYSQKALKSAKKLDTSKKYPWDKDSKDTKKYNNRIKGIDRATNKVSGRALRKESAIGAPANSVSAKGVSMAPTAGRKHGIVVMDRRLRKSTRLLKKYRIPQT